MRYKGKIKELNNIIISDPSYDKSVTCRYERNNLNEENWLIDIDIYPTITPITEELDARATEFFLFLCKNKKLGELKENGTISYLKGIKLEETDIGIDTACVALGINENAKEIINCKDDWQPECALNTLSDGIFGTVKEGKIEDDVVFIWVSGYLDEDTGYSIEDIVDYLQYQLDITNLVKDLENPYIIKQQKLLEKMSDITLRFKEITKEDSNLINYFKDEKRFSNITFAGAYLAGIAVRNEQRKAGNLEGKIEKSPYSKEQEKLIDEHTKLRLEYEKTEQEIENNIDMEM